MKKLILIIGVIVLIIIGCVVWTSHNAANHSNPPDQKEHMSQEDKWKSQPPTPVKVKRVSPHEINIGMTAQETNIRISKTATYKAWTFNGQAPGPLLVVNQGDLIHLTLTNRDKMMPHSIDLHAVQAAPSTSFTDVNPGESKTFTYHADHPGLFMYHCATQPMLQHMGNGMYGVILVKPTGGYPTDSIVDRSYVLLQNEWYKENDYASMLNGNPEEVVFSTKALYKGDRHTNGDDFTLKEQPFKAKAGERIRLYFANMGPNHFSALHIVGTVIEDAYIDGNPSNHLKGLQTVAVPPSGSVVVEFLVKKPGRYTILSHQMSDAEKGASAYIDVK
ncbi:hypothetical protein GCM10011391_31510 [Pullulanibacillus camelliae]|uniref:Copper-containing nitrite reductase n=1 Tax=Pullulanibacillus camelliae TaxID=1707096 RepID=A0A8J2YLB0_9BACL|nr:multicopper oxidase domain-containing protein [Pullulanibacillus camelliae]GGE50446.1 hypothetical protein GCM10011391_31510 [Pullulanibacillus camelliae]